MDETVIMSPEQLIEYIAQLIIDNNTMQISPYKLRAVLNEIVRSITQSNAAAVSASAPLVYDPFTNTFSIPRATQFVSGYLDKSDFDLFLNATTPGITPVLTANNRAIDKTLIFESASPWEGNASINNREIEINATEYYGPDDDGTIKKVRLTREGLTVTDDQYSKVMHVFKNGLVFRYPGGDTFIEFEEVADLSGKTIRFRHADGFVATEEYVDSGLDLKLDAADYHDRWKGKYTTFANLAAAHPVASAGDYAQVDAGPGSAVKNYNYDVEDGWILGGDGTGATNTDALIEGSTNLYFKVARVLATTLSGLSLLTGGPIVPTDSILAALGKLQKQINDLPSLVVSWLETKQHYFVRDSTTSAPVTGTTANAILISKPILANEMAVGTNFEFFNLIKKTGIAGSAVVRLYINTSPGLAGATQLGTYTSPAGATLMPFGRKYVVKPGNFLFGMSVLTNIINDDLGSSSPTVLTPFDPGVTNYFIVAIQLADPSDVVTSELLTIIGKK